jgi:hypothetical protein
MSWLAQHHRKAFSEALTDTMKEAVVDIFEDEQDANNALTDMEAELARQFQINVTEWLLAEGEMQVQGAYRDVSEVLLGPRGPLLTTGQRA